MFISTLIDKKNHYDPYRVHYYQGIRAVIALFSLFCIQYVYGVINPYFYFFYLPITCLSLEILGETSMERTKIYLQSVTWSAFGVLLFGLAAHHPLLELLVVFSFSLWVYHVFIKHYPYPLISAATILSLSAYGLKYQNVDIYQACAHFGISLFAGMVIATVLKLLPQKMYLEIWYRIFHHSLLLAGELITASSPKDKAIQLLSLFPLQLRYARMYEKKQIGLLKTTAALHTFIEHVVAIKMYPAYFSENQTAMQKNLSYLQYHVQQRTPCLLELFTKANATEIMLYKIAREWNKLCTTCF